MKWIKSRQKFILEEAKLRDVLLPKQKKEVASRWAEKYLDYEEIDATENIKQGKWKLSEEDKRAVLGKFLTADLDNVFKIFEELPVKFVESLNASVDLDLLKSDIKWEKILNNFDISKPTINQISVLTDPIFRKISVGETQASEVILRDETGRPVMGEDGRPQKVRKEPGEIVYSKNLTNINAFVEDFNRCFPDSAVNSASFTSGDVSRLVSKSREDFSGEDYQVEVDIYGRDMYLSIQHNAKDILNMSISRFYSSCQNLYTGGYREKVLGNVFDPNSIPAFLLFDSSIHNNRGEHISDILPVSRMMIRSIESFDTKVEPQIFFDRAYPDRMKDLFGKMIEKYSGNKENYKDGNYLFTPDLPDEEASNLNTPYMDRLGIQRGKYIGVNADKIYLSNSFDWSKTKISPKARIKEVVIETTSVPKNFFDIPFTPDWVKFKFISILSAEPFRNFKTTSIAFDKCKLNNSVLLDFKKNIPDIKKIQINACEIKDLVLSSLDGIDELHLIYTLDPSDLEKALQGVNVKKLILSGDLVSENKDYIKSLRSQGVKIEIVGPVI
jgi:hypothetical protein